MSLAVCRAPLLWMNLALGNLVVFLVYGESGRVPFFGLASTVPYTLVAFVLFAVLYPRVTARTSWWVLAAWGGLFSLGVPVLGGFFWGAGHAVMDMFKHGSGLGEVLKGGLVWSFMSAIMSVYLAPPFAVMNITGFFLRRRALQRAAGVPGGQGTAA